MHRGLFASIVVLCGCDGVFKLTELPPVPDAAGGDACRYARIAAEEPGQDEGGDTVTVRG